MKTKFGGIASGYIIGVGLAQMFALDMAASGLINFMVGFLLLVLFITER